MNIETEARTKHDRVAAFLDRHGLDAAILSRRCNVSWYTCGRVRNYVGTAEDAGNSTLLVDPGGARILTSNIEVTRLEAEDLPGTGIEPVAYPWHDASARAQAVEKAIGGRHVAADVPVAGVDSEPLPAAFNRLRWSLEASEVERYRAVASDVVAAVEATARAAEPGRTEDELAGALAGALRSRGLLPWVLLVAVDGRIDRFRHPLPTSARLERRLMLVTCSERGGLIAACTRLVSFGPLPADLAARHEAVATVDAALVSATRPGATLGECFDAAREAYAATGHADEWRNHHQGGSIGYLPREAKAGPGDATPVLANQAFAWNPSISGTKSEDTVLCTAEGTAPLAGPTGWPTVEVEWQGATMERPAILVR